MIRAVFDLGESGWTGFRVSGHSGTAHAGKDIVCAWVTSAVMQCANDITEIFLIPADVQVLENEVRLRLKIPEENGSRLIEGLKLHLQTIAEDHPEAVTVNINNGGSKHD